MGRSRGSSKQERDGIGAAEISEEEQRRVGGGGRRLHGDFSRTVNRESRHRSVTSHRGLTRWWGEKSLCRLQHVSFQPFVCWFDKNNFPRLWFDETTLFLFSHLGVPPCGREKRKYTEHLLCKPLFNIVLDMVEKRNQILPSF